jgi:hypothetical protein
MMTSHITKKKIEKRIGREIHVRDWEEFCSLHLKDVVSCFLDFEPHAARQVAARIKFRIVDCEGTQDAGDGATGMITTLAKEDVERMLAYHIDDRVWGRFIADDYERQQMERGRIDLFTYSSLIQLAQQMETEAGCTDHIKDNERT